MVVYEGEDTLGGVDQDGIRYETECSLQLPRAATHCTSCFGTIAAFQNKFASFVHWQLNIEHFTDPAKIVARVTRGISLASPGAHPFSKQLLHVENSVGYFLPEA